MITDANDVKCYEDLFKLTDDAWDQLLNIVNQEVDSALDQLANKKTTKKTMSQKIG